MFPRGRAAAAAATKAPPSGPKDGAWLALDVCERKPARILICDSSIGESSLRLLGMMLESGGLRAHTGM